MSKKWTRFLPVMFVFSVAALGSCGGGDDASSELQGTWLVSCSTSAPYSTVAAFVGNRVTTTIETFSGTACTDRIYTITNVADFRIGAETTTPVGAREFDATEVLTTYTAINETGRVSLESDCPGTTFPVGTAITVNGKCGAAAVGVVSYSIYKLDSTTSPPVLNFGLQSGTDDGTTAVNRHRGLDNSNFRRQ